jgi:hypothetical protein
MFPVTIVLFLLAALTVFCFVAGLLLLFWRKSRPLGLYALLVEPGAMVGLVIGFLIWDHFLLRLASYIQVSEKYAMPFAIGLVLVTIGWLGVTSAAAGICAFALATWLWWRFSPEPYRSKFVNDYRRFVTMPSWHRPRWNQRSDQSLVNCQTPNNSAK